MNEQLFTEAMSELSDKYITEAINYKGKQKEKNIFYYVKKYTVVNEMINGEYPSDHFPVTAEIDF